MKQRITPFLWFDGQAEQARDFYVSIFRNSSVGKTLRYGDSGPGPKGQVMTTVTLDGLAFVALNGGPHYKITPGISLVVNCDSQAEVDDMWAKLAAGGQPMQCGWLTDRFGVTWQVVPRELPDLLNNPDPATAQRVMQAMMQMTKFDLEALRRARDAGPAV